MDFDSRPAGALQRRVVVALSVLLILTGLALIPFAGTMLDPVPAASGLYGAASASIDLATFLLLAASPPQQRANHILAGAFLFAGSMAFMHLLTFPGAVLPGKPLLGDGKAVGWLFNAWHAGFPIGVVCAVAAQKRPVSTTTANPFRAELMALAAAIVTSVVCLSVTTSPYQPGTTGVRFSMLSTSASYACAFISLAGLALIYRSGLARRSLFLWVSLVMVADTVGLVVGTVGGARYTVGWYGRRIEGVLASLIVLAVLSVHFRAMQAELVATVSSLRSRTDALQAESQRREHAERMLLQSQKLEAVGQLAAGLAHDFNNLMQVVVARLEVLRRRVGSQSEEDVQAIRRAVAKTEGLTRQLMLFTGRRRAQPVAVSLPSIMPVLIQMLRPLVRSDIEIELDVPFDTPPIFVDRDEFEVAVTNIVANARDAMPNGGVISIAATRRDGKDVVIRITDSGTGIAQDVIDRVFEPFFTTKAPGKGAGLGLSQVYAFARSSAGAVDISSILGRGTTITLQLPIATDSAMPANEAEPSAPTALQRSGTILLVDDSTDVRDSTCMLLEHAGYAVRSAGSAREALALIDAGFSPDMVISDIVMPGDMDGLGLAREIAALRPGMKVVLASGYSVATDQARDEGLRVLQKPYSMFDLLHTLDEL